MSEGFDFTEALETVLPPMYAAVLETENRLHKEHPGGFDMNLLGVKAWESLTLTEQYGALPGILGAYAHVVREEENAKRLQRHAEDATHTYLDSHDVAMLWDSVACTPDADGEVPAERNALANVLCELELLQHRLAMRDQPEGGA